VPFEKLVDELEGERNLSHAPLFQVMFNLRNLEEERFSLPGLQSAPLANPDPGAKFSLVLDASENRERLVLNFIFNIDLFDLSTIERMSGHFRRLLASVVAEADRPVNALTHLTSDERQQVLTKWNDTSVDYKIDYADLCIHEVFEQQAALTPDAVALVYESESLSYRELNERANELAHYLQERGVGPESLVAVLLERSTEMVVSLLGVLKAGAAYLPLDPALPSERLRLMLEDSGSQVLLTSGELSDGLLLSQEEQRCKLVNLDALRRQIEQRSSENPRRRASAQNLAYVIYTSGSTGQPKAAMNTHGGIRNRLLWMQQAYCLTTDDCVLQKTPYSFDVSVWEFFWPLMYGAKLVVARPGGHQDSEYLLQLIAAQRITTLHFVPSMLSVFLQHEDFERCRSVRRVICSGEALSLEIVERFFQKFGWAELHNLYGPTEAAVDVSFWTCS
jgi:non-ribosomal peptide synthetase component F